MKELQLDNTWRSTFNLCPAKYHMQRNLGYKPVYGSTALLYGIVWHKCMEGFYTAVIEHGWDSEALISTAMEYAKNAWEQETDNSVFKHDFRNLTTIGTALINYMATFQADEEMMKILSSERKFCIPILSYNGIEIVFTGKLDLEVEISAVPWVLDFKTTGWQPYKLIETLERSNQFMGYQYAAKEAYEIAPDGTMLQIHHARANKLKAGGYGKLNISHQRVPLIYTTKDINRWKESFIATAKNILRCYETEEWPHNYDNCFRYSRCGLWNLCMQDAPFEEKELGDEFVIAEPFNVMNT